MTPCPWPLPQALASDLARHSRVAAKHYGRLLSAHDRLDIAQDALLALAAKLKKGACVEKPVAWLMGVVRNLCAMRCRRAERDAGTVSLCQSSPTLEEDSIEPLDLACRCDAWAELEHLFAELTALSEAEKDDLRDVAAGSKGTVAATTKEKVRKARILEPAKQRY